MSYTSGPLLRLLWVLSRRKLVSKRQIGAEWNSAPALFAKPWALLGPYWPGGRDAFPSHTKTHCRPSAQVWPKAPLHPCQSSWEEWCCLLFPMRPVGRDPATVSGGQALGQAGSSSSLSSRHSWADRCLVCLVDSQLQSHHIYYREGWSIPLLTAKLIKLLWSHPTTSSYHLLLWHSVRVNFFLVNIHSW